jgi:hypothetical protein
MKNYYLTLLFLLTFLNSAYNQFDIGWRGGSAATLQGKTFVLSIFVATTNRKWESDRKYDIYKKQGKALKWLKREAARYGADVSFEQKGVGWDQDVFVDSIVGFSDEGYQKWVKDIFSKTEFHTPEKYCRWAKRDAKCDNCLFVIYVNQRGRSYAEPMRYNQGLFCEGCVVFAQKQDNEEQYSSTIAHECLHLFGAWDLYKDYIKDRDKENLATMYFPKDIMLREEYFERNSRIDKLTAWLVGLTNKYEDWYLKFDPAKQ